MEYIRAVRGASKTRILPSSIMGPIQQFLGPIYIGNTVATALWGTLCVQLWKYLTSYVEQESKWIQALVLGVGVMETAHQIVISVSLYELTVEHFAEVDYLTNNPVTYLALEIILGYMIAAVVHLFYLSRIWQLSKHSLAPTLLVIILILAETGSIVYDCVQVTRSSTITGALKNTHGSTLQINAVQFGADLTISAIMYYLLSRNRGKFRGTQALVKHIMVTILSTNALTSLCSLVQLVLFAVYPTSVVFFPVFLIKGRLYANSFMATLNLRPSLAKAAAVQIDTSIELPPRGAPTSSQEAWRAHKAVTSSEHGSVNGPEPMHIHVDRQSDTSSWV